MEQISVQVPPGRPETLSTAGDSEAPTRSAKKLPQLLQRHLTVCVVRLAVMISDEMLHEVLLDAEDQRAVLPLHQVRVRSTK